MTKFEENVMQDIERWAATNLSKEYQQWRNVIARKVLIEKYWAEYLKESS